MAVLVAVSTATAADNPTVVRQSLAGADAAGYWTAERLRNARPLDLPLAAAIPAAREAVEAAPTGPALGASGKPPKLDVKPDLNNRLFEPGPTATPADDDAVAPQNAGSRGAHFSSTRVFPDAATTTYPYRAVGKLFFTEPGKGDFICSASVLRPRVVVTAGHCVHSGKGPSAGFFTNFLFVPAYRSGVAPYKKWTPSFVVTTTAWINGGANFPNAADYAMFEIPNVGGLRIGDVTGFLGYVTNKLLPNHANLLGYPANLDSGERMHQVTAESFAKDANNAVVYGSDMRGGSSGGPWVQNFGVPSAGQSGGTNPPLNAIVGITSYGPVAVGPLYQGSSTPDARFVTLLNTVCGLHTGNC